MKISKIKLTNKQYDLLKMVNTIIIPALMAMIVSFGELYQFDSALIVGTISILNVFFGVILRALSNAYGNSNEE